jgi:hypothetical protein
LKNIKDRDQSIAAAEMYDQPHHPNLEDGVQSSDISAADDACLHLSRDTFFCRHMLGWRCCFDDAGRVAGAVEQHAVLVDGLWFIVTVSIVFNSSTA